MGKLCAKSRSTRASRPCTALTSPELEISVVRVFIPVLERLDNVLDYIPGARAAAPFGAQIMNLCILTGPTLPAAEGQQQIDAIFLPPAARGDIYCAALKRPVVIGLINGYFERVPSVSHKDDRGDQKLSDVLALLEVLNGRFTGAVEPKQVRCHVEPFDASKLIRGRVHRRAARATARVMEVGQ
ncbi:hypothetical protein [Sorangium sp. So ce176]|uniref:hypothetical protein n=1 Tax=Sorangium sp. So ce176 TaxID=3133286 RepID=UPI003F5E7F2F